LRFGSSRHSFDHSGCSGNGFLSGRACASAGRNWLNSFLELFGRMPACLRRTPRRAGWRAGSGLAGYEKFAIVPDCGPRGERGIALRVPVMLDEGIYLFFDNDCVPAHEDGLASAVAVTVEFMRDMKSHFMRGETNASEGDKPLKPLGERAFRRHCRTTRAVRYVCVNSFLALELGLSESVEAADCFRDIVSINGFMFGAEVWDATCFWTGASIRRWFKSRFPAAPETKRHARTPSVLDLLYEFLEDIQCRPDDLVVLKQTIPALAAEDRLLVDDMLRGKDPGNSKRAEAAGARVLRAVMDRRA